MSHLARAEDSVLVVVDVQPRLAGAMEPAERERVLTRIELLLEAAGLLEVPVLATEQYPSGLGATEPGIARHFPAGVQPVEKTCFSCQAAPGFREALAATGRGQVILTGMETHICVLQTALELADAGRQAVTPFVVADAVCARHRNYHDNGLDRLRAAGVTVTNSESVLFEWVRDAGHEHFKAVSRLVKNTEA